MANKKILIFCGSDDPHKSFPPFMLGCGAQALDMDLTLFFTLSGLNIIRRGYAEKIQLAGAPATLPKFIAVAKENGARLIACSAAFPILGIKADDFIEGVDFGGVAEFVSLAEEADVVLTFC
ncbi:MAG: DsrE/DsrF/DrsH-like family protein [Thermoguttaceae bacterium]|nr:DsrE/DsrF/DrsH-like family protein [Thermoguttaceae bacterium]